MKGLSGLLWLWREKPPGDPDTSGVSRRPTPRTLWHWLLLFTPSLGLALLWLACQVLPIGTPTSVFLVIDALHWPAFGLSCFALGFWWRRKWVGDRFGHGIMAGFAILAFNIGATVAGLLLFVLAHLLVRHLFHEPPSI
jgi:hypothetical protein